MDADGGILYIVEHGRTRLVVDQGGECRIGDGSRAIAEEHMALIGGRLAYEFLRWRFPGGTNLLKSTVAENPYKEKGLSKLAVLFGDDIFEELAGKTVMDFGSGDGENCIELAERGVTRVIGLDIQESRIAQARAEAARRGVASRCEFVTSTDERADVVLSTDAFEHFADPAGILRQMRTHVKDDGYALVEFGYPWYHPYGGHLFAVFPWSHLIFTEASLIRWRSDFKTDGARRFGEVAGGLNQMTIARWERLVRASPFEFRTYELVPIRAMRRFHNRLTREFFTSFVRARLQVRERHAGMQTEPPRLTTH
jgi:SAM-dependent methyltransferase